MNKAKELRELKAKFAMERATTARNFELRQVELSHQIDMAKNTLHYCNQSMRQADADVEALKTLLDAAVECIHELSQKKVQLDFDRKEALIGIEVEYSRAIAALDARYSEEGGAV